MLCYRDMTFCVAACSNAECPRKYTNKVRAEAEAWWGGPDAPVAVSDFTLHCAEYIPEDKS